MPVMQRYPNQALHSASRNNASGPINVLPRRPNDPCAASFCLTAPAGGITCHFLAAPAPHLFACSLFRWPIRLIRSLPALSLALAVNTTWQAAVVFQKPWLFIAVGVCVVGGAAFFGGLSPYLCAAFALPLIEHALLRLPQTKPVLLPAPLIR